MPPSSIASSLSRSFRQLSTITSFPTRVSTTRAVPSCIQITPYSRQFSSRIANSTSRRSTGGPSRVYEQHQHHHRHPFSTTTPFQVKSAEQLRARAATGVFSWKAALLFVLTGAGMVVYFQYEKARLERARVVEMSKGVGKPKVGGPFVLKDLEGNTFTEEQLKGKYAFVYFGFTHCPDICPDELDKMAEIIDLVREKSKGDVMRPVFITCDPARDTPGVLKEYLSEFHKGIIGLTGTYAQVKDVCKQYRVYFSTPEKVTPGEDYLVDHSIYFYLMDPEGDFVECIGRQDTVESATKVILDHIGDWKKAGKPIDMREEK